MTDLIRLLVEICQYVFPFRIVWQWEQGALYLFGRFRRTVGPGCYPIIPFFMDVRTDGVVERVDVTPLQTVMTRDGGTLTFSATITLEVADLGKAYNEVMRYDETALETAGGLLAERLTDVDPARLDPENRRELIRWCKDALEKELGAYGLRVKRLRFNNFVRNMRIYRLFSDQVPVSHA